MYHVDSLSSIRLYKEPSVLGCDTSHFDDSQILQKLEHYKDYYHKYQTARACTMHRIDMTAADSSYIRER